LKPPAIAGICDLCGGQLIHRKDDTAETIQKRVNVYNQETKPLLEYIRSFANVFELDADRPENIIFDEIVNYLKKM
jgi:adenylate kinase